MRKDGPGGTGAQTRVRPRPGIGGDVKIDLKVNGKPVVLNPFVSEMISKVVIAMVGCLKGMEKPEKVEIGIAVRE